MVRGTTGVRPALLDCLRHRWCCHAGWVRLPTAEGVPRAGGGAPGRKECFPALGATGAGCTGCGATARVDEGAQRAPHPNGLSVVQGGGEGGRGFWTQNLVYQKWPNQIFPIVNFVFSHYGHFGLEGGGGGFGGGVPLPWFLIILKKPCSGGGHTGGHTHPPVPDRQGTGTAGYPDSAVSAACRGATPSRGLSLRLHSGCTPGCCTSAPAHPRPRRARRRTRGQGWGCRSQWPPSALDLGMWTAVAWVTVWGLWQQNARKVLRKRGGV